MVGYYLADLIFYFSGGIKIRTHYTKVSIILLSMLLINGCIYNAKNDTNATYGKPINFTTYTDILNSIYPSSIRATGKLLKMNQEFPSFYQKNPKMDTLL